ADAREMRVVGVLTGTDAEGREPDLPGGLVDALDPADEPVAARDLLERPGRDVDVPEVVPAVPLAGPQEPGTPVHPVHPGLLRVVDEGVAPLLDHRAHGTRG